MAQQAPEHQDRGLFGRFGEKKEEEGRHNDHQMMQPPASQTYNQNQPQAEAASYYPSAPQHGAATHNQAQAAPYYPTPPHGDHQMTQPPNSYQTHNQSQAEAASYYPTAPQHSVATHNQETQAASYYPTQPPHAEHGQDRPPGYEGQYFTVGEAEKQQHTGVTENFHRTDRSGSSSSSDEEEEGGQRKKGGGRRKVETTNALVDTSINSVPLKRRRRRVCCINSRNKGKKES